MVDTCKQKFYKNHFELFCEKTKHNTIGKNDKNLINSLKYEGIVDVDNENNVIVNENFPNYLEIGPGTGFIYDNVGKYFQNRSVIEMNDVFAEGMRSRKNLNVIEGNILELQDIPKFDVCLILHVIYYISKEDLTVLYSRLKSFKNSENSIILTTYNENSDYVKQTMEDLKDQIYFKIKNKETYKKEDMFTRYIHNEADLKELISKTPLKLKATYQNIFEFDLKDMQEPLDFLSFILIETYVTPLTFCQALGQELNIDELYIFVENEIREYLTFKKVTFPIQTFLTDWDYVIS